jgi:mono/diheme cytochrome c family protein
MSRAALAAALVTLALPAAAQEQPSSWTTFAPKGRPGDAPLIQRGQEVFQARCNLCHGVAPKDAGPGTGSWMAGTQALAAKYKGSKPALLEERTDLTPQLVRYYVRHGSGVMPFFRKTELSDADLDALGAYLARKRR